MLQRERTAVNPGTVEWSGDNPGVYLKDTAEGDWRRLSVYFNIVLSPHGRGKAMVVLGEPDRDAGEAAGNICITDNRVMMSYLRRDFLSKFPSFRGRAGLDAMTILSLEGTESIGSPVPGGTYRETVWSGATRLSMSWQKIGEPFAVEVSPDQSATGEHDMYSLFFEAEDGGISIDDNALPGTVVNRPIFGISMSSAFLALSETWVKPNT